MERVDHVMQHQKNHLAPQDFGVSRRRILRGLAATAGALAISRGSAIAQSNYPTNTVRIISPFAPGGNTDIVARLLANHLTTAWHQPVIVENRAGAGATIGTDYVAKSPPDGQTLLIATLAATAIAPSVYSKLPYDPSKDLVAITGLTIGYSAIGITPSLPVRTLPELIAYARARPKQLFFASPGIGVSSHLAMENFAHVTNLPGFDGCDDRRSPDDFRSHLNDGATDPGRQDSCACSLRPQAVTAFAGCADPR